MAGDVLLEYDRQEISGPNNIDQVVQSTAEKKMNRKKARIPVKIWRDGKKKTLRVSPGELGAKYSDRPIAKAIEAKQQLDDVLRTA